MLLNVVTPPAVEPVSLTEARTFLRVDFHDDDALIESLIGAARTTCELLTKRTFLTTQYDLYLDGAGAAGGIGVAAGVNGPIYNPWFNRIYLDLPRPPLISLDSIHYLDSSSTLQTLDTSQYSVQRSSEGPGRVFSPYNRFFPFSLPQPGAVTIRYTAGYGSTPDSVPDGIKTAMKLLISHWYQNRELSIPGKVGSVPFSVESLLAPFDYGYYA